MVSVLTVGLRDTVLAPRPAWCWCWGWMRRLQLLAHCGCAVVSAGPQPGSRPPLHPSSLRVLAVFCPPAAAGAAAVWHGWWAGLSRLGQGSPRNRIGVITQFARQATSGISQRLLSTAAARQRTCIGWKRAWFAVRRANGCRFLLLTELAESLGARCR